MKIPKQRIKSKFHHHGKYGANSKAGKKPQKGAFGKTEKPKLEPWQLPDDPKAALLEKCIFCGLPTSQKSSYGQPMCEFCKEDYKREKGEDLRFVSRHREIYDDDDES